MDSATFFCSFIDCQNDECSHKQLKRDINSKHKVCNILCFVTVSKNPFGFIKCFNIFPPLSVARPFHTDDIITMKKKFANNQYHLPNERAL